MDKNEIAIIQNKIYVFRGQQVMTDATSPNCMVWRHDA